MSRLHTFKDEEHLASVVISWMRSEGFEVYGEVQQYQGGPRADIVGTRGPITWIVEVKMRFGLGVMEQCEGWVGSANVVVAAVPLGRNTHYQDRVANGRGISVLRFQNHEHGRWGDGEKEFTVRESMAGFRRVDQRSCIRKYLRDGHKTMGVSGTNCGGYYTPFKGTCEKIRDLLKERGRVSLREAMKEIEHHYANEASARGSISELARKGVIAGVGIEYDGRTPYLVVAESSGASSE